ncbi:hypothetical protein Tco_0692042 [Tanacetum coccineum]
MSPKSGGWDQFGSNIATALICLSTGKIYNFSKLIFDGMVANLKSKTKFLMYPHFLQMVLDITTENKHPYLSIAFTKKIFGNMKRGFRGVPRPLLPAMLLFVNQSAGQEGTSGIPPPSTSPHEVRHKPTPIHEPTPTPTPLPASKPAPITESTPTPTLSPAFEPMEHIPAQQSPTPTHEPTTQTMKVEDLLQLFLALITRIDALETELKETKTTMGKAIVKLIKKVKKMKDILKRRRVVLPDSEDEEVSNSSKQGRNLQKDKSEGYETPKEGTTTGDMDISPQGLEAAETLSQIKNKRRTDKTKEKRRLDEEDISPVVDEVNTASEVPLVSIVEVSTASRTITYSRRSAEKKTIKDKGKAIMTEPEPEKKSKRQLKEERLSFAEALRLQEQMDDEQRAQIARDEEIARQWEAEERQRAIDEAKSSKIDWTDPSVIRYHAQKMKPKTVAQARRNMIKYLKNQGNYQIKDFKGMSYNEVRPIFEKVWDFNQNIEHFDKVQERKEKEKTTQVKEEVAKKPKTKRKKSIPTKSTRGSAKRHKTEKDTEKEGLKEYLDVVPKEDVAIDVESLSTKYPIVDWKTHIDVEDLYRLVKERFATSRPEGYDLMLWGDLHTLFEPNEEDKIWKNQHDYDVISWSLYDHCGVHILLMHNGITIHMLTEKSYPLSQEMMSKMLSRRLEVDHEKCRLTAKWSEMELRRITLGGGALHQHNKWLSIHHV